MGRKSKGKKRKALDKPEEKILDTPKTEGIYVTVILLLSFAVYSNSLFNGFVFDDKFQILQNPWIRDIKNLPEIFTSSVWSFQRETVGTNYYRPLMHTIYMFIFYVFGLKPWGFHLINIVFHVFISVLVFIVTKRLLSHSSHSPATSLLAFIAALLFATHPIHTEAVAWISALPDLSYTFFYLLSFYFYMKFKTESKWPYLFSLISFSLATLCKEPALTLPIILIVYDYVFKEDRARLLARFKIYIPYIFISLCYLGLRFYALGGFAPKNRHVDMSAYEYFINVFPLFSQYLEKLLLPVDLNAYHLLNPISSILQPKGIFAVFITAVFIVLLVIARKKNKIIFFSFFLIVIPLLPTLYIPAIGETVFAERYLYLPSSGFVILIAFILSWANKNQSKLNLSLIMIAMSVIGLYFVGTMNRNAVWRDNYSLYSDMVKKSPEAALPHYNLGNVYTEQGKIDEAINEYRMAVQLNPNDAKAHNNLGLSYEHQGRINEALDEYQAALKLKPDNAIFHYNLGNMYAQQGKIDEAINEYRIALQLNPNHAKAHQNLDLLQNRKRR